MAHCWRGAIGDLDRQRLGVHQAVGIHRHQNAVTVLLAKRLAACRTADR